MNEQSVSRCRLFLTALLVSGWSVTALAQTDSKSDAKSTPAKEKSSVTVKVLERTDTGDLREQERTYRFDGMKDDERDKLVEKIIDSVRTKQGDEKGQVTVIVEDADSDHNRLEVHQYGPQGNRIELRQGGSADSDKWRKDFEERNRELTEKIKERTAKAWEKSEKAFEKAKDAHARRHSPDEFRLYRDGRLQNRHRLNPDSLKDNSRHAWPENFSHRMKDAFRDFNWSFDESGKAPTIHGLEAYPNNPDTNELNIRFSAPSKGDIHIRVTTPDGKEIAKKEIKEFAGNYTGQLDLGKKAKGVLFVNVSQNEDGAVKRVVVP